MSKPGTANGDEDFVRRRGSLKREISFDSLGLFCTQYISRIVLWESQQMI